ncbi:MAG: saccharopine dehydrogenase NADP-binding domain-containing protein [Betaproteobacteria bacterium]|nr:saccharopine dehydrogenase NADP-binding domain-containing protein [Betaproteobacteria bacterium]
MAAKLKNVAVLGLGKVGSLVGTLLTRSGFLVTGIDANPPAGLPFDARTQDMSNPAALKTVLAGQDAVISCLPFHLNVEIARIAHASAMHYFDLTEDVPTTKAILEMARTAKSVMAPQCGLAPGFIGILGADLASHFDVLRSIELRVGALPQHPRGKLGYALNWSPEGVINEYINDCEVIRNGHPQMVPALEGLEIILVHGLVLEAFTTSGGLGTMCETYFGKVQELNYKTMRYPGHCELMKFLLNELYLRNDREVASKLLKNALPAVDEDVVFVHAAVEGQKDGRLSRDEYVRAYPAMQLEGRSWRAISWTTAASICAVVEMVAAGSLPEHGFIKQEEIPFDKFLATQNGSLYRTADSVAGGPIFSA